jgi:hypothetical protein
MANVHVITEEQYRNQPFRCTGFCWEHEQPTFITADQLYGILNSATDDGTTKEYVLVKGRGGVECATVTEVTRNLMNSLSEQFDELLERMQTPEAREAMRELFNATSTQLGEAALREARRKR